ncbi:DotD/TraH family lipoprotein [Pseudomonas syringae]|uniref:DotD/TraH family lipoprotein n=1 Tax=Pseudomonas ovata TaxID=1839709 RepID=UPI000D697BD0|nr:DotD/TraH family lipoprotein [Pseudomonas ovata]MBD8792713.1 DotD/TraH family lipoprotein [Pseudomonas syringae]MBD8803157.1 DotD/TraH family lipoprotein [Pseudomonas syringae]MBD8813977.1 DotD/TraH family lipoprotein [Pseudomonas syringae]
MKHLLFTAPAVALLLAGCQAQKPATPDPALVRLVAQQQVLWQEGVINTVSPLPADMIKANTDQVSVNWSGDAVELLSHLAVQRGARFNWTGVRLPLPVNIHVRGVTYQNLLQMIRMQTAWRADLQQMPSQLTLAFMPAQAPEQP